MISYQVTAFGRPLERAERPTPEPAGSEILLRVAAAGVCHTDLHTWEGAYDLGGGRQLSMRERGVSLPLTLGHEIVGEVLAAGPDAAGVEPGQMRLVYPWIGCGTCSLCQRGRENLCPSPRFLGIFRAGGYSDHVMVPHPRYLIDIGTLSPEQAAPYACSGLTTYSAIRKIDPHILANETVVVIGAGGVGLMGVTLLRALGCPAVGVVETDARRREAALKAGAAWVVDGAASDALEQVKRTAQQGVWAVVDCVGSAATVAQGLAMLTKGGQLIIIGLYGGEMSLSPALLPMRAVSIVGSYIGNLGELQELMELVRRQQPAPVPLDCRCLDEAGAAMQALAAGNVVGRIILKPGSQT